MRKEKCLWTTITRKHSPMAESQMQGENARLRDELLTVRGECNELRQSNYILGQMGRWTSYPPCPPCPTPCGMQSN